MSKVTENEITLLKTMFEPCMGLPVVVTITDAERGEVAKFDNVSLTGIEVQKSTGMKNAPNKRTKDGKSYTPPMFALVFGNNRLVFVNEDTTACVVYNGVKLILDNTTVSVVKL
jgi:hypothetical protein